LKECTLDKEEFLKEKLLSVKEIFNVKDDIKIKVGMGTKKTEIIQGKIIQITDFVIVVKTGNYTRSFKYIDFYTKSCAVIQ
jgi:aspartate aminotransferase-like enzyme